MENQPTLRPQVSIFGYGSLMNKESTLKTLPSASNFAPAILQGYQRAFHLVSISGLRSGRANLDTKEMAALSIYPAGDDQFVYGCVFDIEEADLVDYFDREHRYKPMQVTVKLINASYKEAYTVISQTDEEYINKVGNDYYQENITKYYSGRLWDRTDILPMTWYLELVLFAAIDIGHKEWLDSFLNDTLMADLQTTVRTYIYSDDKFSNLTAIISRIA